MVTCHETVIGASKGMIPVKMSVTTNSLFLSVDFYVDHKTVTMLR